MAEEGVSFWRDDNPGRELLFKAAYQVVKSVKAIRLGALPSSLPPLTVRLNGVPGARTTLAEFYALGREVHLWLPHLLFSEEELEFTCKNVACKAKGRLGCQQASGVHYLDRYTKPRPFITEDDLAFITSPRIKCWKCAKSTSTELNVLPNPAVYELARGNLVFGLLPCWHGCCCCCQGQLMRLQGVDMQAL